MGTEFLMLFVWALWGVVFCLTLFRGIVRQTWKGVWIVLSVQEMMLRGRLGCTLRRMSNISLNWIYRACHCGDALVLVIG